jgi:hypothetical protein
MRRRRATPARPTPPPPTVPDLVLAPELAAIMLLEHALIVATHALIAEHPTLVDDFARARDDAPALFLAHRICLRAGALEDMLRRYRRAVSDAARRHSVNDNADSAQPF